MGGYTRGHSPLVRVGEGPHLPSLSDPLPFRWPHLAYPRPRNSTRLPCESAPGSSTADLQIRDRPRCCKLVLPPTSSRRRGSREATTCASGWPARLKPVLRRSDYSRGPIFSAASLEVMTGYTSKSVRSLQFAIHRSSRLRSSVSMSWKQRSSFSSTQLER